MFEFLRKVKPKPYKITKVNGRYIPWYKGGVIKSAGNVLPWWLYTVGKNGLETEAEAGALINEHAALNGAQETIWEGG